jgi:2-iminobutanoate/2-iminopropanoate deaminase
LPSIAFARRDKRVKKAISGEAVVKRLGAAPGPYSYAIEATGRTIYIAGQVALMDGKVVSEGDFGAQYRHILENIRVVLEAAGASMDDVVKMVHYVVPEMRTSSPDFKALVEVRKKFFHERFPVSTLVRVAGLLFDGLLIEVDAWAVVD